MVVGLDNRTIPFFFFFFSNSLDPALDGCDKLLMNILQVYQIIVKCQTEHEAINLGGLTGLYDQPTNQPDTTTIIIQCMRHTHKKYTWSSDYNVLITEHLKALHVMMQ